MAPGRGGYGFLKWYSLCNSLPDGYDLLHTLLFLIFAAMMLLANARFRVAHQARADGAEDLQLRGLRPVRGKSGK